LEGEKSVSQGGGSAVQPRAGVLSQSSMPGVPGSSPMGAGGGQSANGKPKRQERREPPVEEQPEPDVADPWQAPGRRDGGQ
jgi:hypothetical protein